ncbi:hypothetical protein J5N97_002952 [Dioscorea zingiberensis]|uniref:Uncharacterized protein n=1 Tax=Dioscorea zingiberensis TaxID=325984 RepID=A0A9D5D3Q8_9LILI|nr:hypothetical protein J5N97_002952 [Dioscorea zingiberensis]
MPAAAAKVALPAAAVTLMISCSPSSPQSQVDCSKRRKSLKGSGGTIMKNIRNNLKREGSSFKKSAK